MQTEVPKINMKLILAAVFILAVIKLTAQPVYTCNKGEVMFFSKAPLEDIQAKSRSMSSVINITSREIVFVVPVASFKFRKGLMQEHFNDKYMESDKYPNAAYKGKISEEISVDKDGEYEISSTGMLSIHGVEKQYSEKGKLTVKNGEITVESNFKVNLKDHDIDVPRLLLKNIAEAVEVSFIAVYVPYKKENKEK